jgi:hypothetical protein
VNKGERRKGLSLEKDSPALTTSSDYAGLSTSKHDVTVRNLLRTSENSTSTTFVNKSDEKGRSCCAAAQRTQ